MKNCKPITLRILVPALAYCWILLFSLNGHAQNPPNPNQTDDVLRVNTELVQTDVMVFDRRGHFVDGLKPEDFVLSLDGQTRKVSIFERVTSGSTREATQLRVARSTSTDLAIPPATESRTVGRVIFFFVDDLHLSGESLARTRKALLHFVDNRMNPGDQVAVVSTSGQVGFLQQLTDNATVLHTAISRLNYKRNTEAYAGTTRISEYMASRIEDGNDRRLFAYLMESVKLEYGMGLGSLRGDHGNDSALQAHNVLKSRLGQIRAQSKTDAAQTVSVLQSLMDSSASMPGRKLVFFFSDGFMVDPRGSDALSALHQATRLAARTGAVIYTLDMRGTTLDSVVDASNNDYVDMSSRHAGVALGETNAPREPLNVLADETGGRLIVNSSALDNALEEAVRETSNYYMLAWRPGAENERVGKAKIEVTIQGRSDLRVHWRRSYFVAEAPASGAPVKSATVPNLTPEAQLLTALGSARPQRLLPTALSVGYIQSSESALVLQASMQIAREAFNFDPAVAKQKTDVDVIGAAINDRGLIYTFKQVLTVTAAPESPATPVIWNQQLTVRPGLYQVRVAVRERTTGRTGSAMQWIEIPAATPPRLSMSSLFLGERRAESGLSNKQADGPQPIRVDVDHRFARSSALRFQTYVYNAARSSGATDVWIQAQVLRGRQQVAAVAPSRIPPDISKDPRSLPYWSEIGLSQLPPGLYTLEVSASDKVAGTSARQSVRFSIE
jgi:VWFA-related protein